MRLSKLLIFVSLGFSALAQEVPEKAPKKGDFMFPVRPKQENYLSANMSELRSSHFHTGLDIKTSGITGLPVYAAADGYVQRVRVSLGGYGNALYIVHPHNNTITVYAHLESFDKSIAPWVRENQYKKESFEVNLFPNKDQFVFKKGDVIALSGNSGSSLGPHLHFEIRNLQHKALDPLKFGFPEIEDNMSPVIQQIAFVTMDIDSRVNGMFGRFEFNVVEKEGNLVLENPVSLFGRIGVEIYAYDQFDGTRNRYGIVDQMLMLDFEPIFSQSIQQLEFNLGRNILSHNNFKRIYEGGRKFNKLYIDDGNRLKFYQVDESRGIVNIQDPLNHSLDVRLEDSYGNVSQYHFPINQNNFRRSTDNKNLVPLKEKGYDVRGAVLELMTEKSMQACPAKVYVDGFENIQYASYSTETKKFYLWDMNWGIPDSAKICHERYQFFIQDMVPSAQDKEFVSSTATVRFPKNALFDSIYLRYNYEYDSTNQSELFNFDNPDSPLRKYINFELNPQKQYVQEKSAIYSVNGKNGKRKLSYVGGEWEGGTISFKNRDLIPHTIATDSIPPVIEQLNSKSGVRFKIEDELSGIKSYRAELDGKWLLMNYDAKSGRLWSDDQVDLKGKYVLEVVDNAQNSSTVELTF